MPSLDRDNEDKRVKRTKTLVFNAFFEMVQSSRYDEFKTKDIIAKADIGRSTFYTHFLDKDDVLSQSLERPMSIFAAALVEKETHKDLLFMLVHFWDRRTFARVILKHPTRNVVEDCLRKLVLSKINATNRYTQNDSSAHASFLSSGFLSLLNEWLTGRLNVNPEGMCQYIRAHSLPNISP